MSKPEPRRHGARILGRSGSAAALLLLLLLLASCAPAKPAAVGPETAPRSVSLFACGDIMLSRSTGALIRANGFEWPFTKVKGLVSAADLSIANLEGPASFLGSPYPRKPPEITFRADPGSLIGLKNAGFDFVSLANNHMNDYGPRALVETTRLLDALGIAWTGAGSDLGRARKAAIVERKGFRIAFLGYANPIWSVTGATADSPGVVHTDLATMVEDIARTRAEEKPDFLFLTIHWDREYEHYPLEATKALAHGLIAAGADGIFGHHSHVPQGIEIWNGGLIVYSLGNFVFDMTDPATQRSFALNLELGEGGLRGLEVVPIRIEAGLARPHEAVGAEADEIDSALATYSAPYGTRFERVGDRLRLLLPAEAKEGS